MKRIIFALLWVCFYPLSQAQVSQNTQATPDHTTAQNMEDPTQTIKDFFEAFHAQDTTAMRALTSSSILQQTIIPASDNRGEQVVVVSFDQFLERIVTMSPGSFKEEILSYDYRSATGMVHVFTPYRFFFQGELSHSGVNSFLLVRVNGAWKIAHIIDTRIK